jgi:hypothetical protein
MGHTIWVEIKGRPTKETAQDSSIMHRLMDNLDALAGKLGVQKLSDFYDYSELERAYGDFDESEDSEDAAQEEPGKPTLEQRQAKGKWFDSTVGVASVRKLREHLAARFADLGFVPDKSKGHWPKRLMDELTHTEAALNDAAAQGQQFRLLIVP